MTEPQSQLLLWNLWPKACKAQDWKVSDRSLRLAVFTLAVNGHAGSVQQVLEEIRNQKSDTRNKKGRVLASASELNTTTDFDAVKRVCLMLAYDLKGANDTAAKGQARRFRNRINEQLSELVAWPAENPMGTTGAALYLQELIAMKFNHGETVSAPTLDELTADIIIHDGGKESPSQLEQIVMTVQERLDRFKQLALRKVA